MAEEILRVTINKDGTVEIKVEGVKGNSCTEITYAVEKALGGEVIERVMTAEAYEGAEQDTDNRIWT